MWFHLRLLEACNLRCTHCYAKKRDRGSSMTFELFREVVDAIVTVAASRKGRSVIYLSGGEPLLHPDFLPMLDYAISRFDRVNLLTNGLKVADAIPELLPYRDKLCIQVSLEGDQHTNDAIRGPGVYEKASRALHLLDEHGFIHWMSYSVSEANKHRFESIIDLAKATRSFFNNVTPYTGEPELMLSYEKWKEFKYCYERYGRKLGLDMSHGPNCCGFNYACGAFVEGITVNPEGTVAGCARMNQPVGTYRDMAYFVKDHARSIHETCMSAKWGGISNFRWLTRLE